MSLVLASGLLAAAASAAPVAFSTGPASLVPARTPSWLKTYSTAPLQELWTAELTVKDIGASLPKILEAAKKEDGALTQDLKNFATSPTSGAQQLSFAVPRKRGEALLKRLRRLGDLSSLRVTTSGAAIPLDEVRAKIARLTKERAQRAAELARTPVADEIEGEILAHLLTVEAVAAQVPSPLRLDLLVKRR